MRSLIVLALALWLTGPGLARAQAPSGDAAELEQVLIEFADTPAEHQALADYYRGKAGKMRGIAEQHRSMGKRYGGTKAARNLSTTLRHPSIEFSEHLLPAGPLSWAG